MRNYELHASPKQVQRSGGRSSVAAAAYRSSERLHDERTGDTHDYTRKQGVELCRIYLPDNAPDWAHDREKLWNAAEFKENRKNSMTAREYEIGFPAEFNAMQRREAGDTIARELVSRYNCGVDAAFHTPSRDGDQRNHHAHILYTTRGFDETRPDGWARNKYRDISSDPAGYDENGDTLRTKDGKIITRAAMEVSDMRHFIAGEMNRIAERDGLQVRTEHLSFEERGIDREPTQHLGPHASQMEKEGQGSDRGATNRAIVAANDNHEMRVKRQDFTTAQATMQHRRDMVGYYAAKHKDYGTHKAELIRTEAARDEARVRAVSATFFDRVRGRDKAYQDDLDDKQRTYQNARQRLFELVSDQDRKAIMGGDFAPFHRQRDFKIRDEMRRHREELKERHKEQQAELKNIEQAAANRSRTERIMGAINGQTRADETRAAALREDARIYEARQKQHERFLSEAERARGVSSGGAGGGQGRNTTQHEGWNSDTFWRGADKTQDPRSFARVIDQQGDRTTMQDNFKAANRAERIQATKEGFLARAAETRAREQGERTQSYEAGKTDVSRPENMTREERIEASKQEFQHRAQEQRDAPGAGGGNFEDSGQPVERKIERE